MAPRIVPPEAIRRLWGDEGQSFRLVFSHRSEFQAEAAILKNRLSMFSASGFVAHMDVRPTREWQEEIENTLATMHGFVTLMTPDYHDSDWADQEVGYAVAQGVPIIAVTLGQDRYGFIGKFQALTCN